MKNTSNPNNTEENLEKLKTKINKTEHNAEIADEIIRKSTDDGLKKILEDKNDRRKESLNLFKRKLKQD